MKRPDNECLFIFFFYFSLSEDFFPNEANELHPKNKPRKMQQIGANLRSNLVPFAESESTICCARARFSHKLLNVFLSVKKSTGKETGKGLSQGSKTPACMQKLPKYGRQEADRTKRRKRKGKSIIKKNETKRDETQFAVERLERDENRLPPDRSKQRRRGRPLLSPFTDPAQTRTCCCCYFAPSPVPVPVLLVLCCFSVSRDSDIHRTISTNVILLLFDVNPLTSVHFLFHWSVYLTTQKLASSSFIRPSLACTNAEPRHQNELLQSTDWSQFFQVISPKDAKSHANFTKRPSEFVILGSSYKYGFIIWVDGL